MHIGFVGLGQMGAPIARNLLKGGLRVTVSGRHQAVLDEFRQSGASIAGDVAALAGADLVFLCLPDGPVVRDVLFGLAGLASHLSSGKIVVDLSTISHAETLEFGRALAHRGVEFVDAPISGMAARARDATLTVMCGGSRGAFDTVRPVLELIGNKILYLGESGSGQLAKLINQLLFDVNAAALAELLPMAARLGLDCDLVGEIVNSGTGRSYASEFFIPRILQEDFSAGYPMQAAYKDLVSAAELTTRLGIPLPVLAASTATYQAALLQGHGAKDKGGMIRVFEDLLGVKFRTGRHRKT